MFGQFFGNYLLNKNYITENELREVLKTHQGTHTKIGVIALNEGVLTPNQIEKIHLEQSFVDKKFGEIAIDKGYISEIEFEELLKQQKTQLKLIQTIVDNGYMSLKDIQKAVEEFKKEYSIDRHNEYMVRDKDIEKFLEGYTGVNPHKQKYTSLLMRNIKRLIDSYVFITKYKGSIIDKVTEGEHIIKVSQSIRGSLGLNIEMYMNDKTMKYLSKNVNKDKLDVTDEEAVEGFMSINTGMYVISLLSDGLMVNMDSQSRGERILCSEICKEINSEEVIKVNLDVGEIYLVYR